MADTVQGSDRRSPRGIAADLREVRKYGGLWQSSEKQLAATLDLLALAGYRNDALTAAKDLLAGYVRRTCEGELADARTDQTGAAAATSLKTLLLRPAADSQKASLVRSRAARSVGHKVTSDAIRKREDKLIEAIAEAFFRDLQESHSDEPRSLEEAIHRLVPVVSDIRQHLHDGLCLIYMNEHPADPRERIVTEAFYRHMVIKLGILLLRSAQLVLLGLKTPNLTVNDDWFVRRCQHVNAFLFDQHQDRSFMLDFATQATSETWDEDVDALLSSEAGRAVYDRWLEWVHSCYPTCAFERTTDVGRMCTPHSLVTLLYEIEIKYVSMGYSELKIEGNEPLLHHRLQLTEPGRPS